MMVSCFSILTGVLSVSAEVYPVALSSTETIALYGSSIPALYYTGAGVASATFELVGTTNQIANDWRSAGSHMGGNSSPEQLVNPGEWSTDSTIFYGSTFGADGFSPQYVTNSNIRNADFLIYRAYIDSLPASGSFDFQIKLDFALDIQCQGFASLVAWSSNEGASRLGNTQSTGTLLSSEGDTLSLSHSLGTVDLQNYYSRPAFFVNLGTVYDSPLPDETSAFLWEVQPRFCLMPYVSYPVYPEGVEGDAQTISIASQELLINKVTATPYALSYDAATGVYGDYTANCVYLLVQCPLVYGDYIPPEPEYNTDENINNINNNTNQIVLTTEQLRQILLRIETNSADILTVERVHTSQFIDIIDKLNDIYNNMQGSLNPALTPAQGLTPHDAERETLKGIIGNTAPTASQLQPFAGAIAIVGGVFGNLVSATGLATTAGICVTLLVFQWVLKRGRGQ